MLATKQAERRAASQTQRCNLIQGKFCFRFRSSVSQADCCDSELSRVDRDAVEMMDVDGTISGDVSAVAGTMAPGESLDLSHEGGEHEACSDLIQSLAQSTR